MSRYPKWHRKLVRCFCKQDFDPYEHNNENDTIEFDFDGVVYAPKAASKRLSLIFGPLTPMVRILKIRRLRLWDVCTNKIDIQEYAADYMHVPPAKHFPQGALFIDKEHFEVIWPQPRGLL